MESFGLNPKIPTSSCHKLAISWLTMFVVGSDLFVVSPLLPLIAADYAIPLASAGLSMTIFSVSYMLSAPLRGRLADRIGRGRVLRYSLCAFGAANLLTAIAGNVVWLLAARCFAGAAAAGVSPSVYALIGNAARPDRRATWLAVAVSGLLMSLSLGAPIGLLAAASLGWPVVFAGLGILGLVLAWANNRAWRHSDGVGSPVAAPNRLTAAAVCARLAPTVAWSTAVYTMYIYLGDGLASLGYSTEEIARVILFYGCGAISGALIGGRLADRFGARSTGAFALGGLGLCILLLRLALDSAALVDFAFAVSSLAAQLFFPAQQIKLANEFPASRATILAWNNSALFLGISLGSLIGGQALSLGGFDANLMVSATIASFSWIAYQRDCWHQAAAVFTQLPRSSGMQGAR
jgi:predicted MFS family arabinose efflux permease